MIRRPFAAVVACATLLGGVLADGAAAKGGIGPLVQFDVAETRSVPARLPARARGAYRVRVRLVRPDGTRRTLASARRMRAWRGERAVRISAAGAEAVRSCAGGTVVVTGRRVARRRGTTWRLRLRRDLELTPPACGRFFGPDSIWNRAIPADAPLDDRSSELSKAFADEVHREATEDFGPNLNVKEWSVPIYTVGPGVRRVPVILDVKQAWGDPVRKVLAEGAPIPDHAQPAKGGDRTLAVWQPSSDTTWEYWGARKAEDGWHAKWGGRMKDMSTSRGFFPHETSQGATASRLATVGGLITPADVAAGRIDHALAVAIPNSSRDWWSLPAQRTDGFDSSKLAVPQGARFRLDPSLDIAELGLPPLVRMIAEATQQYGFYVRDKSAVVTFYGQDPAGGPDVFEPFAADGPWDEQLARFPWDHLQLMPMRLRTWPRAPKGEPKPKPDQPSPQPPSQPAPPSCGLPICPATPPSL